MAINKIVRKSTGDVLLDLTQDTVTAEKLLLGVTAHNAAGELIVGEYEGESVTINNQDKTITENGTYTADSGYTGLGTVTVDVQASGGTGKNKLAQLVDKTVTEITAEDLQGAAIIGMYAFEGTTNLQKVVIPSSCTEVKQYCFMNSGVVEITGGENLTITENFAFQRCQNLINIEGLKNVEDFGYGSFTSCTSLKSADFPNVKSSGSYSSSKNAQLFVDCTALETASFESINGISYGMFSRCSALKRVYFPSIKTVYGYAFIQCTSLEIVDFSGCSSVPSLTATNAFNGVPTTCKVVVPDALYDEWIAATNWAALSVIYVKKSEVA